MSEGNENLILGIGPILDEAIKAKMEIRDSKNKTSIVSMGSVKPLDTNFLEGVVNQGFKRWIVLEEHSIIGGLGSSIIEWKAQNNIITPEIIFLGAPDKFIHNLGNQSFVRSELGLNKESIKKYISD